MTLRFVRHVDLAISYRGASLAYREEMSAPSLFCASKHCLSQVSSFVLAHDRNYAAKEESSRPFGPTASGAGQRLIYSSI
jgi:hypothetical protein